VLLDVRTAGERLDAGMASTMLLWGRLRGAAPDEVRLAVMSDHVPYLMRRAFRDTTRVSTVTSSLRVTGGEVSDWILLDISLQSRAGRSAIGRMNLWSADGRLVAVAEQTVRLSFR
jgi:acyl-CoA thioesterase